MRPFILFAFLLLPFFGCAQEVTKLDTIKPLFVHVDQMPSPRVNVPKFLKWHLHYPPKARKAGIEGRVVTSFIVEEDGKIDSIKVTKGIGGGCDEEAVRVIRKMRRWNPGIDKGKKIRVRFILPINFKLT